MWIYVAMCMKLCVCVLWTKYTNKNKNDQFNDVVPKTSEIKSGCMLRLFKGESSYDKLLNAQDNMIIQMSLINIYIEDKMGWKEIIVLHEYIYCSDK